MNIRKAEKEDLPYIYNIYESARSFMISHDNPDQWGKNYPPRELTEEDEGKKRLYVVIENGVIEGVFVFFIGEEEAYNEIEGEWSYSLPYGVIHRVASSGKTGNITRSIFNFALTKTDYLRIDTHEDNAVMKNALLRYGFRRCGTIHYRRNNSTTERIAFDYKR